MYVQALFPLYIRILCTFCQSDRLQPECCTDAPPFPGSEARRVGKVRCCAGRLRDIVCVSGRFFRYISASCALFVSQTGCSRNVVQVLPFFLFNMPACNALLGVVQVASVTLYVCPGAFSAIYPHLVHFLSVRQVAAEMLYRCSPFSCSTCPHVMHFLGVVQVASVTLYVCPDAFSAIYPHLVHFLSVRQVAAGMLYRCSPFSCSTCPHVMHFLGVVHLPSVTLYVCPDAFSAIYPHLVHFLSVRQVAAGMLYRCSPFS